MSFVTIYDLKMSGYTSSRTDLHEGCLNMLRHVYDTDDIHIQEIVRDPSFKKRQFIYPESYAVTVTFVVGRVGSISGCTNEAVQARSIRTMFG